MTEKKSRRDVVRLLGTTLAIGPFVKGCGGDDDGLDAGADGGFDASMLDATFDSGTDGGSDAATDSALDAESDEWASGGTAAMTDSDSYPNPFVVPASCALFTSSTLGPCFASSPVRRDVSEGEAGLPVRLALQILDADCAVIEGAHVDIWHTGNSGLYSEGPIEFCTDGDAEAEAAMYFRGAQVTDADGQVAFDTCFPGWYVSRAIHIHFQVFMPGGGSATKISQLYFDPDLTRDIFASHVDYAEFGQPAVTNAGDSIYASVGEAGILETSRMTDGAMLAWKQIRIL